MSSVFVKVLVNDRLPKRPGYYHTDYGIVHFSQSRNEFNKVMIRDGELNFDVSITPKYWLEEIELPSLKTIDEEAEKLPRYSYILPFIQGVNFILNKLKIEAS